ncbi:MAG: hypothetical protein E7Z95_02815 [Actinomyces succiniciruminis]|nr:hypothetical protein [Actinomyces succiniciruminis]
MKAGARVPRRRGTRTLSPPHTGQTPNHPPVILRTCIGDRRGCVSWPVTSCANERAHRYRRAPLQSPAPAGGLPVTPDLIVRALHKRWSVIVALSALAAVLGVLTAATSSPVYRSSVTNMLTVSSAHGGNNVTSAAAVIDAVAPTLAEISMSSSMLEAVAEDTGIPTEEVAEHITVSNPTDTLLIVVRATGSSPEQSRAIAASAVDALAERTASMSVTIGSASMHLSLTEVDTSSTAQLIGPSKSRNGAIGLIAGACLGLLVALRLEATRQSTVDAGL